MVEGDQGSLEIREMGPGTAVCGGRLVVGFPGNALCVSLSLGCCNGGDQFGNGLQDSAGSYKGD